MDLPIKRMYIANRGEIALRIINACRILGIETVVGVSDADRSTMAARVADRAICIGPAPSPKSYLNKEAHITAALGTGCDSLHPGYGFLSEKADFSRMCSEAGLIFIGPSGDVVEAMGDKIKARVIAEKYGVPTVPGSNDVGSVDEIVAFARAHGFPLLLKAAAGGGGRGMRIVRSEDQIKAAFEGAVAEAKAAFGDGTVFLERYIERARHIEIQVMGDKHGNVLHFGERDCSTQRRHQKLIEEAPSPVISEEQRTRMASAAVTLARAVSYVGAGTVEFIYDSETGEFYFLEMNTRIQVEHPVTEMVTGIDLVVEQIACAAGKPLALKQDQIMLHGHAIECRINAESASRDFMPSPGRITTWLPPSGPGVRLDSHCYEGYVVPPHYDSMIGKLIVHADNRQAAIDKMLGCFKTFRVEGIETTIPIHQAILAHSDFTSSKVTTRWVEEKFLQSSAH